MNDSDVEHLIQEVRPVVRRIAQGFFLDAAVVEDAIQEHALVVWGLRGQLDEARNAREYVVKRMYFVCLRIQQSRYTRQPDLTGMEDAPEPVLACQDEDSHLRDMDVRKAFDSLPVHLWIVAWLVYGEGFLVSETARRLGLPRLLAEQRLQEATQRLQALLQGWR